MDRIKNRIGDVHSRLTVIEKAPHTPKGNTQWLCKCICGNTTVVRSANLVSGNTTSCGCRQKETALATVATHGMSKTSTYGIWNGMMMRCYNSRRRIYPYYGGRGIRVCKRWHTFANFFADMGERPGKLTIERKNTNKDYSKSNCVWASRKAQAVNRRTSVFLTFGGISLCRRGWEERLGLSKGTLYGRLTTCKWPLERALTEAAKPGARKKTVTNI